MKYFLSYLPFFMALTIHSISFADNLSDESVADEIVDDWDDAAIQQEFGKEPYFYSPIKRKDRKAYRSVSTKKLKRTSAMRFVEPPKKQKFIKSYTRNYQLKAYKSPLHNPILYQRIK